jgi:hypothetical protein
VTGNPLREAIIATLVNGPYWVRSQEQIADAILADPTVASHLLTDEDRAVLDAATGKPLREATAADGATLIAAERTRQITAEGWTAQHDQEHTEGELIGAACAYASGILSSWPDGWQYKPSKDPIRNLVRAGALIAAEIDRLRGQT